MKVIMNPPYAKSLHLKILSNVIQTLPDAETVNLSPIRWLQDPLAEYKSSANWKRFANIREKIADLDVVSSVDAQKLFNIEIFSDLGIFYIGGKTKVDTKNFWKQFKSPAAITMIEKLMKMPDSIENHCEKNKLDGIRVPLTNIGGNRGYKNVYKDLVYVIDGKKDGKWWYECKNMGGYEKPAESPLPISIKFATENEAQNFYDSFFCKFYAWLCDITHILQTLQPKLLPWLGDYTHPWTDEMLYDYFNLTQEEREIIENEV